MTSSFQPESSKSSRGFLGDQTDEYSLVDRLHFEPNLAGAILAEHHLIREEKVQYSLHLNCLIQPAGWQAPTWLIPTIF